MKTLIKGIFMYDFYLIPTVHIYSRRKDTYNVEFCWLKFYIGWEKK